VLLPSSLFTEGQLVSACKNLPSGPPGHLWCPNSDLPSPSTIRGPTGLNYISSRSFTSVPITKQKGDGRSPPNQNDHFTKWLYSCNYPPPHYGSPCSPTRRASLFSLLALLIITGFSLSTPYLIFPHSLVPTLICLSCRLRHRSTTPQPLSTEGTNVTLYCPKCPRSSLTYVILRGHVISSRSASGELMQKSAVSRSRLLTLVRIQC
jgi:hypothetical protein